MTPYHILDVVTDSGLVPLPHLAMQIPESDSLTVPLLNPAMLIPHLGIASPVVPLPTLSHITQMQGPGMAPVVAPLLPPLPHTTQMGPGMPPAPLPTPVAQLQGPGLTAAPSCPDPNTPSDADQNASSSCRGRSMEEAIKRKYTYRTSLKPGIGISAK